jgi:hypothetical protein
VTRSRGSRRGGGHGGHGNGGRWEGVVGAQVSAGAEASVAIGTAHDAAAAIEREKGGALVVGGCGGTPGSLQQHLVAQVVRGVRAPAYMADEFDGAATGVWARATVAAAANGTERALPLRSADC